MADQEQPDHTEDPREQDVGQGYPETTEEGAAGGEGGPAEGTDPDEPRDDTDREASTGNPHAAG